MTFGMGQCSVLKLSCLIALISLLLITISSCSSDDNQTVTVYSLKKMDNMPWRSYKWKPLNPTSFKIGTDKVVMAAGELINEYHDCKISSVDDWECRYGDGSLSFGFKKGAYWKKPEPMNIKTVSRISYNISRYKWLAEDYDSSFQAIFQCLSDYK